MKQKKFAYIFAGILVIAIIVYFIIPKGDKTKQILVKVKKGPFPIEVTTTGELLAKSSEKIYGPAALKMIQVWQVKITDIIADGTKVDSGQYVATLDRTDISNKIKDEQTNLDKFETQLAKTKLDTSLELRRARDELINLKYAKEEKNIALEQSKYEPPATIRQIQIEMEKASRGLDQAEKNYMLQTQKAIENMKEVTASYNQALRKLQLLTDGIQQFVIKAPKAGMVIYRRSWDGSKQGVNSTISAWENVVAELPDLSVMISKTYVNEIDISKIKVGQEVRIGIDAFPEKKFTGKVTEVANIGEQIQGSNAKVFEVKIIVNEFDSILRPAMTTKNTIVTATIDNVMFVPIESVFSDDSTTFVFRKNGGSIDKQQIIVGQSNENEIIVKTGLKPDDELYLIQPENFEKMKLVQLSPEEIKKYEEKPEAKPVKVKGTGTPPAKTAGKL